MRRYRALVPLAGALALLAACGHGPAEGLPGTLERERIELAAQADEPIVEIAVAEGQAVAAGALLLVQDPQVSGAQLDRSRAALEAARARQDELRRGPLATSIAAAAARVERARSEHDDARRERERLRDLAARQLVSQAAFDRQASQALAAEASLREAQAALRELREGTREEQLRQAARAVEEAEAAVRELQLTGARLEVRAPRAAVVDALPWKVGERPPRSATVAVLLAGGAPFARIRVPAARRLQVAVGTSAVVRVDGVEAPLRGRVRHVSGEAAFTPYYSLTESDRSRLSYLAEVEIVDAAAATLPAGLPVEVELLGGAPRADSPR